MKKLLDPAYWARALRNPVVLAGLVIDLAPIAGVLLWGWGAAALVLLYWTENIIAGIMTLPRLIMSSAPFGGMGILLGLAMSAFFVFHYGLFCAVHGSFLMLFASFSTGLENLNMSVMMDIPAMIRVSLASGLHMTWMVGLIFAWQVVLFFWEFVIKGTWKTTTPMAEMFAPYQRIVILHFAIFAGAGALILLGEPMIGVLALIVLRALFGVATNASMGQKSPFNDANMPSREAFQAALRGEKAPD